MSPSLPFSSVPFADKLPKLSDVVADAYDFAGQLLAAQRKFAEDVIQITAPLIGSETPAPAAKKTAAAK